MEEKNKITLQKLREAFGSVYLLEDPYIIKVLVSLYVSHLLKSDPIWLIIVAPSAGGKSEIINALSKCKYVHPLSTLTANTFLSGISKGGESASLLHNLSKGTDQEQNGIITFKDLTSILSENKDTKSVLMAQMREIYDGRYIKQFGTGKKQEWAGKVTVIAGSTYAIHSKKKDYVSMGERFLFYNFIQPEAKAAANKSMENQESGELDEKRGWLADLTKEYIENAEIPKEKVKIPETLKKDLISLAEFSTRVRSEVERNWRSPQQEITEVYPPEMPTRMAAALQTMARALSVVNFNETGKMELQPEDHNILYKIALDSIPSSKRLIIQELAKYNELTTTGLATKIDRPTTTVRYRLEELVALEVAERAKGVGPYGDRWKMKDKYIELVRKFEKIKKESDLLDEENAEESQNISESDEVSQASSFF